MTSAARWSRPQTAASPTGRLRRSVPDTGLFYVPTTEAYSLYYLTETDPRGAMGLGGKTESGGGTIASYLTAIDYKTGKIAGAISIPVSAAVAEQAFWRQPAK